MRPVSAARNWESEGADGLHVIDLDRVLGVGSNEETLRSLLRTVKIPVEVGGGMRSVEEALRWIKYGASRVIVGTLAYADPDGLRKIVEELGPQRIAVAIDFKGRSVVVDGWRQRQKFGVLEASRAIQRAGVRTIVVTAVERDGTASGPDFMTYKRLCNQTEMNILASGGIRSVEDVRTLNAMGVDGVILGRALYDNSVKIAEARLS
jgi:phosphoribosylformimino-5-aminoimidazole carboxamide ribotide isomerase